MVVGPQVDVDQAIPKLGALGVNTVRLRMSVKDWSNPAANTGADQYDGALQQAPKLADKGFRVVLQVDSEGGAMPSYARAKELLQLADGPARGRLGRRGRGARPGHRAGLERGRELAPR